MDKLIKGFALDGQVRLIGITSMELVQHALNVHRLSPVTTVALGRLLTGSAIMGAMLKNDTDRLTITLKGTGPIGKIIVCSDSKAWVKGYVENPLVDLPAKSDGSLDVGGAVGKSGMMTVIKDTGLKEPYSGNVEIVTGEIGDEFAKYFVESEQTPTAVSLGVSVNKEAVVTSAGGYLLQLMPGTATEIIDMVEDRIRNMRPVTTLLKEGFSITEILKAVSGDDNIVILEEKDPKFLCDCSRERMQQALITIPIEERERMKREMGYVEIKCSFCGRTERW